MEVGFTLLRSFVAIVDAGTISGASDATYLSQPALSKQLQRLESAVGAQLVDRSRRGVNLTPAGSAILPHVRAALDAWERGGSEVAAVQGQRASTVRIGLHTSMGRGLLRKSIELFTGRFPGWSVQIRQVRWDDPTAGLASEETDVALTWSPRPRAKHFNSRSLGSDELCLLGPEDHPLMTRPCVDVADLAGARLVAMPPGAGSMREFWLGSGRIRGVEVVAEAFSGDEYYEAVASGLGLGLVSAGHARLYQRDGVSTIPITGLPTCHLYVTWRRDEDRTAVNYLADVVAKVCAE